MANSGWWRRDNGAPTSDLSVFGNENGIEWLLNHFSGFAPSAQLVRTDIQAGGPFNGQAIGTGILEAFNVKKWGVQGVVAPEQHGFEVYLENGSIRKTDCENISGHMPDGLYSVWRHSFNVMAQ